MSGTLSSLGSLTIGQAVPCLTDLNARIRASVAFQLPNLQAIAASLKKFLTTPPTVSAGAAASVSGLASLRAQVSAGLPGISVSPSFVANIAGKISADIGTLNGHLSAGVALGSLLGTGGVQAYSYTGAANQLSGAVSAATAGGFPGGGGSISNCNALILSALTSGPVAAMQLVLGLTGSAGLSYLGQIALAQALPQAPLGVTGLGLVVSGTLPLLAAQIAAYALMTPGITIQQPSLTGNITAMTQVAAQLGVSVSIALPVLPPLPPLLPTLLAQLAFCDSLPLGVGGLAGYVYTGDVGSFAAAIGATFAGTANCNAVIFATESTATWSAMQTLLKVS